MTVPPQPVIGAQRLTDHVRDAYHHTARSWQRGPARIYDELARALLDDSPRTLSGRWVADLGAGTGAATRACLRLGAHPIAIDTAGGMLAAGATTHAPCVVADVRSLPFASGSFDVAVAAYLLNHLLDPERAIAEAVRILRPGGVYLASVFAADWQHPAKQAVEIVAARYGYVRPTWYEVMKSTTITAVGTAERLKALGHAGGLIQPTVSERHIRIEGLTARDVASWRLGMANMAPFVRSLDPAARQALTRTVIAELGDEPFSLEPHILHLVGRTKN